MITHPDDPLHVAGCAACRAGAQPPPDVDLGRVWLEVAGRTWSRPRGPVERLASSLLGSPGLARALVTTPSLLRAYVAATAAIFVAGAVFERGTGAPLVAVLAPALAGAGIAYAYGPGADGVFELSRSMPVSGQMVLLARALAVFALNSALGLGAAMVASGASGVALGWLVPMTAVCGLALAVATVSRSAAVGVSAGLAAWCATVLASTGSTGHLDAATTEGWLVPAYVLIAIAGVVVAVRASRQLPAAHD
ncbi:MAG TPA: hypothetical protein VGO86_16940 [Candidatus Dormibacteraeota bacterium]|jgi:hypothetical protein